MDSLQRVGGGLESHRRPSGSRAVLLPFEVDLCEQLGITAEEYWEFVANAQDLIKERPEEYAHIPDIQNGPVVIAVVQIVVGLAVAAISALMAPKPKQPEEAKKPLAPLAIEGSQGRSRYTKASNFDSVQSLASLGETIPLIFADQSKEAGGIRIDTQLLFSQMITAGTTQTLMAVMLIGAGELREKPDYNGFAIGDLMLRDFSQYKNQLFCNVGTSSGNRLRDGITGDQYKESLMEMTSDGSDAFSLYWSPNKAFRQHFSGTRTPSAKTAFGLYNPLPNGFRYLMPYELCLVPSGEGRDEEMEDDAREKREKVLTYFSRCAGIVAYNDREATYYLSANRIDTAKFKPWGAADILQAQDETRVTIDEIIQEGQEYMLGSCRAVCTDRPTKQWAPEEEKAFEYKFLIPRGLPGSNNKPPLGGTRAELDETGLEPDQDQVTGPWSRGCVQQLSVASLSNTRPCDATEIGIKSEVWRQCTNTANFNAHPDGDTIDKYQEANSGISLGSITKYTKRYSFFRIFARESGQLVWRDINDGRVFAVRGVSPEYVFNTLFIKHKEGQHEFEIVPVPGSEFYTDIRTDGVNIHLLDGRPLSRGENISQTSITGDGYQIFYTGVQDVLTVEDATNPEWIFSYSGQNAPGVDKDSGPIINLDKYDDGRPIPQTISGIKSLDSGYDQVQANKTMVKRSHVTGKYTFWWLGEIKGQDLDAAFVNVAGGGGRELQFRIFSKKQATSTYTPATWGDSKDEYDIDFKENGNHSVKYGVIKDGANYNYYWNSVLVVSTTDQGSGFFEGAGGSRRYERTGGVIAGSTENIPSTVEADMFNIKTRDADRNITAVNTGMVVNAATGKNDFYRSQQYIGSSNTVRLPLGNGQSWKRERKMQDAVVGGRTQLTQSSRSVDFSERTVSRAMTKGVIWRSENRWLQVWYDGNFIGECPGLGLSITVGGIEYYCDNRYSENGTIGNENCTVFNVITYENLPTVSEMWTITKYADIVKPDTWKIRREMIQEGSDGKWWIEKVERGVVGDVEPVTSTAKIDEGGNNSASVNLRHYKADLNHDPSAKDAYSWTLKGKGNGYKANTTANIDGTNIKVRITDVKTPRTDIGEPETSDKDVDERFWDFIQPNTNYSPLNAICDYYINNTDTSSHANSPEHQIVFCNELIEQYAPGAGDDSSESPIPDYSGLALAGIKLLNSKEWTSFNSLSAYIKHGHLVERLFPRSYPSGEVQGNKGATNLFPEIAHHLLTNSEYGAGKLIGAASVDRGAMEKAARFCQANGFFWDGIVTEGQNLRQFIFENAAFMLLDFTIKGGKFALVPSVPYDPGSYVMQRARKPEIKALFTDGNMRAMEVSFLSPEERQPFVGVCIFRKEKANAFPELRTMTMRLSDSQGGSDVDPVEKFDCSAFMTTANHARHFLRYALKVRQLVDHGIKFETTPQSAMNLEPGEYFRVASKSSHTDRFNSGSVDNEGHITSAEQLSSGSNISIVYWRPGETAVRETTMSISNNKTTNTNLFGCLFCRTTSVSEARVYKCESLSYAEDGLVEVTGSVSPLNDAGQLLLLDWEENDSDFKEETF